jgi:hypothetical protein
VKVRILKIPDELQVDGVQLNHLVPGEVSEVSPSVGSWLIVQGYAVLEMRSDKRGFWPNDSADSVDQAHDRRKKPF